MNLEQIVGITFIAALAIPLFVALNIMTVMQRKIFAFRLVSALSMMVATVSVVILIKGAKVDVPLFGKLTMLGISLMISYISFEVSKKIKAKGEFS